MTELQDVKHFRALEHTGGRVAKAAELLGVARTTLWDKIRRIGLPPGGVT